MRNVAVVVGNFNFELLRFEGILVDPFGGVWRPVVVGGQQRAVNEELNGLQNGFRLGVDLRDDPHLPWNAGPSQRGRDPHGERRTADGGNVLMDEASGDQRHRQCHGNLWETHDYGPRQA